MVKKKQVKKIVKKKVKKVVKHPTKIVREIERKETEIGRVTHFFDKIKVAVIELSGKLKVGDEIRIIGNTTDFTQKVRSIQIEHEVRKEAKKGDAIGMKVDDIVREHDKVYVLS
jgi:putative protease